MPSMRADWRGLPSSNPGVQSRGSLHDSRQHTREATRECFVLTKFQIACRAIAQERLQQSLVLRLRIYALGVEAQGLSVSPSLEVLVTLLLKVLSDLYHQ